jgi:hypothetical protein
VWKNRKNYFKRASHQKRLYALETPLSNTRKIIENLCVALAFDFRPSRMLSFPDVSVNISVIIFKVNRFLRGSV